MIARINPRIKPLVFDNDRKKRRENRLVITFNLGPATLHNCDALALFATLADSSIDAIVTDPPYALTQASRRGSPRQNDPATPFGRTKLGSDRGFMGQTWDTGRIAHDPAFWAEALRVAKPGAHLLAFGGTRTSHRLACAIEDAGWEIRDTLMWVYGGGMPKSANSQLKPAWEPIIMARKPLIGTIEQNVAAFGTGAINTDRCRIPYLDEADKASATPQGACTSKSGALAGKTQHNGERTEFERPELKGRFPANILHDGSDEVTELFPEQSGGGFPQRRFADKTRNTFGEFEGHDCPPGIGATSGNASRFFYSAKASKEDREVGNSHPTVKPTALMAYLCRLITPPGGIVLDPFMGSGSTGKAAIAEGFRFMGCDNDVENGYFEIAKRRIERAVKEKRSELPL